MSEYEITATDRASFFATFSRRHEGALVTVRVGSRNEVVDQPFFGVSVDGDDLVVTTRHHGHRVPHVRRVQLEQTRDDADAAIAFTSEDGTRTDVRFHSPMRADLLDPAVE